jgi:hypothetical protein
MKRRTFVRLTTGASVAFYLPNFYCRPKTNDFTKTLARPVALQHICDSHTIMEIGKAYQQQAKNENDEAALIKLLSANEQGKPINETMDSNSIAAILNQKIQQDFQQNRIVVANGWVLSVTEARQCALFSLTEK